MDTTAFCHDIFQSRLFDFSVTDADEYAELLDVEVKRVLDIHAPLRTGRRRSGQHDNRRLSDEARHAKQLRRCERRYRRTGLESDRQAYLSACSAARDCILKSRAGRIKSELDEVSGDIGATRGKRHRDCYKTTTGSYTTTPSVRSLSLRSASSSWTKLTGSATVVYR